MIFNKQAFIIKLDFFLRHWHSMGRVILKANNLDTTQQMLNFFWAKALEVLYLTRYPEWVQTGIGNQEEFGEFCQLLTIGMNQLNAKVEALHNEQPVPLVFITGVDTLIKEHTTAIADDIAELFTPSTVSNE